MNKRGALPTLFPLIDLRVSEITFLKDKIYEKWNHAIAKLICEFTMEDVMEKSLHNLMKFNP